MRSTKMAVRVEFEIDVHWGDESDAWIAARDEILAYFKRLPGLPQNVARNPRPGIAWIANMTGEYAVDVFLNPNVTLTDPP